MDELKRVWQDINLNTDELTNLSETEIRASEKHNSLGLIENLRKGIQRKLVYCVLIAAAFGIGIPFMYPLASQIMAGIVLMAYLIGSILLYQELQLLKKGLDMTQSLLNSLISYRNRINQILFYEETIALCLYPISAASGFLFGMLLYNREAVIMTTAREWGILIVLLILLTLAGHWLARWMNKKAFGKYLEDLNSNINSLQDDSEIRDKAVE